MRVEWGIGVTWAVYVLGLLVCLWYADRLLRRYRYRWRWYVLVPLALLALFPWQQAPGSSAYAPAWIVILAELALDPSARIPALRALLVSFSVVVLLVLAVYWQFSRRASARPPIPDDQFSDP